MEESAHREAVLVAVFRSIPSAPALAQSTTFGWNTYECGYGDGYRSGHEVQRQIDDVERQINRAEELDWISPSEERNSLRQLAYVERLFRRYRWNGIEAWETPRHHGTPAHPARRHLDQ